MFKLKRLLSSAVSASVNALTAARDAVVRLLDVDENTEAGGVPASSPRNSPYRQQQQQQESIEEGWETLDYLEQQPRPVQFFPTSFDNNRPVLDENYRPVYDENDGPVRDENRTSQNRGHVHVDYYANSHREEAAEHNRLMKEYYSKAREATKQKEYERAKRYREKAKEHKELKIAAHKKGVEFVLSQNPINEREDTVDLHGLLVNEAVEVVKDRLDIAKALNIQEYHIITGRGVHSKDHQPKIKPRIMQYLNTEQYCFSEDEHNPGSLTVFFTMH